MDGNFLLLFFMPWFRLVILSLSRHGIFHQYRVAKARNAKLNHQISLRQRSPLGGVAKNGNSTRPPLSHISKIKTCDFSTANCMGIVTIPSHCCGFFLHCPLINLLFVPYFDDLACVNIRNVNGTWDNVKRSKIAAQLTSEKILRIFRWRRYQSLLQAILRLAPRFQPSLQLLAQNSFNFFVVLGCFQLISIKRHWNSKNGQWTLSSVYNLTHMCAARKGTVRWRRDKKSFFFAINFMIKPCSWWWEILRELERKFGLNYNRWTF